MLPAPVARFIFCLPSPIKAREVLMGADKQKMPPKAAAFIL
jgi:hypothetical protein